MIVVAEQPGSSLVVAAPAKLNLFLELTGKRPDSYHNLESLMIAVDLFDTLEFTKQIEPGLRLTTNDPRLPTDERNLAHRAARMMNPSGGLSIHLTKRIPSEAGMGGGSSDAAATIEAVNRLFGMNKSLTEMQEIAANLGSDVGFFLSSPAAWCTGRGEIVVPVPVGGPFHFVIVKPAIGCPTAEVYKRVSIPTQPQSGIEARKALEQGDLERLSKNLHNRLQESAFSVAPRMRDCYKNLSETRPLAVQVTGSGSAIFALCRSRKDAIRVADVYPRTDETVFVVRSRDSGIPG